MAAHDHAKVCAVVLAGGRGSRMGGADKGLQAFRGQPLVLTALQRLQAQCGGPPGLIAINANRNLPAYAATGFPVWPDAGDDYAGPLAGLQTALAHIRGLRGHQVRHDYLLTTPCDSPLFPMDLLQRLYAALHSQNADIAVAMAAEIQVDGQTVLRSQPVFSLVRCSLKDSLDRFVAGGGRKMEHWFGQHALARVAFNRAQDDANAFANANTLEELQALERL